MSTAETTVCVSGMLAGHVSTTMTVMPLGYGRMTHNTGTSKYFKTKDCSILFKVSTLFAQSFPFHDLLAL